VSGRVLVVVYYFPPLGGVGVQRTLKYVTYLPKWGWRPSVLTPRNPAYTVRDPSLVASLPRDLEVIRTACFEPGTLPNAVLRRLSRPDSTGATDLNGRPTRGGLAGRLIWKSMILWGRLWHKVLFPDSQVWWVPFGSRAGRKVHKATPFDVVYSTSAPISGHIIAARIAAKTGLPWVADFRDPWIGNAFAPPAGGLTAWRQRRLERKIVEQADLLVFATDGLLEAYAARYPQAAAKMRVIPNGYDRADLPAPADSAPEVPSGATPAGETLGAASPAPAYAAPHPATRPFRLIYTGSLFGDRELSLFLEGLDLLAGRRPEVANRLEVEFVGWLSSHSRTIAAQYSANERIGPMLRFSGFLPRIDAMRKAVAADALLQLIADDPRKGEVQGGKLMEYLGYDRQILAVVPEGQARQLLRELDWGIIADPTPEGVAAGLEQLLAAPAPTRRADPQGRYDRVNLARELAGYLDEAATEHSAK
jgi:glycosyltransferase involved in cell wall biosynthesis